MQLDIAPFKNSPCAITSLRPDKEMIAVARLTVVIEYRYKGKQIAIRILGYTVNTTFSRIVVLNSIASNGNGLESWTIYTMVDNDKTNKQFALSVPAGIPCERHVCAVFGNKSAISYPIEVLSPVAYAMLSMTGLINNKLHNRLAANIFLQK